MAVVPRKGPGVPAIATQATDQHSHSATCAADADLEFGAFHAQSSPAFAVRARASTDAPSDRPRLISACWNASEGRHGEVWREKLNIGRGYLSVGAEDRRVELRHASTAGKTAGMLT